MMAKSIKSDWKDEIKKLKLNFSSRRNPTQLCKGLKSTEDFPSF